jgi:5-methylcytosine-specific restriction endonuclease McrA
MRYKSKRSRACDISQRVKDIVWERDGYCCILCGSNQAAPNSHYIPRSLGGLGIPENITTMCLSCHETYERNRKKTKPAVAAYLRSKYPDWDNVNLIYQKFNTITNNKGIGAEPFPFCVEKE